MEDNTLAALLTGVVIGGTAIYLWRSGFLGNIISRRLPKLKKDKPIAINKEVWEWDDWKGRKRTITVHREVKAVG